MRDILFLAWRYLAYYRFRTVGLVTAISLVLLVPAALQVIVTHGENHLRARARDTPLVLGAKGSALELTLNSLYLDAPPPATIAMSAADAVGRIPGNLGIPVSCRFTARGYRVVGTVGDYYLQRGLRSSNGQFPEELGECVIGAAVARDLKLAAGDRLVTDALSAFDLAGVYPLELSIVGTLAPTGTPDDRAVFTSLETTWIIEGLGHGHDDLVPAAHDDQTLAENPRAAAAHKALKTYRQVTEQNRASFHFHGDRKTFPVTAVLVFPENSRAGTLLEGELQSNTLGIQLVVPEALIDRLLETVLTVRSLILLAAVVVGAATVITIAIVYCLALRLRQNELETIRHIGCSRGTIPLLICSELALIGGLSLVLTALLTLGVERCSDEAYRWLIQIAG